MPWNFRPVPQVYLQKFTCFKINFRRKGHKQEVKNMMNNAYHGSSKKRKRDEMAEEDQVEHKKKKPNNNNDDGDEEGEDVMKELVDERKMNKIQKTKKDRCW